MISRATLPGPVRVAVTAHMTSMRITMETVFLRKTAPVCTVAKYSMQDRSSKPNAKHGNTCILYLFIQKVLFLQKLIKTTSLYLTVSVVKVTGTAKMSLVLGRVKFMETDNTRPLTPNGSTLMDTVSTHL